MPPDRLGAWLRDFDELLEEHGLRGVPYGHFGEGCVHVRIDFEFDEGGRGRFREFLVAGAEALRRYGGSLSGEHGDGRARSELLPLMYDEESLRLFAAVKAACDPDDVLNPGVLVDPVPVDADLRAARPRATVATALRLTHDAGSLADAVHRCTGVGKCVAPTTGGVMCPSYLATRDEKDSTRGRARVLQEALDGSLVRGLADPAVTDALDLCLSCKGCATRLSDRHRHGDVQGGGAAPAVRRPASAAVALHARSAAEVGRAGGTRGRSRQPDGERTAGPRRQGGGRRGPAAFAAGVRAETLAEGSSRTERPRDTRCLDLGGHVHRPVPAAERRGRDPGARGCRADRRGDRGRGLLRTHLDHDRPARPRAPDRRPDRRHARAVRRERRADHGPGAVLPRGAPQRCRRADRRPPRRRARRPARPRWPRC